MVNIIITLVLGGLSGWIAGKIMDSEGGVIRNIIIGLIGGVLGSALIGLLGFSANGTIAGVIVAVAGSCLLIWLVRKFVK
ncbi:MAG: GlsB/YeaQ/YmgE family stress response membrane protein [Lachnospiraceae bacterium]|nr:GlsB/YeaQ/YmgE family stress response membrane protein [Lachnospiraceae bacterium]MCR5054836.1 GlsB/YeaQ/YmgE family stress response membrane protein [Lachnospiraceae bacterium]